MQSAVVPPVQLRLYPQLITQINRSQLLALPIPKSFRIKPAARKHWYLFSQDFDFVSTRGHKPARRHTDVSALRSAAFADQLQTDHVIRTRDLIDGLHDFGAKNVAP